MDGLKPNNQTRMTNSSLLIKSDYTKFNFKTHSIHTHISNTGLALKIGEGFGLPFSGFQNL
jgi:hypothetical protein